ncbi:protein GVQW3-like [Parasteatoda tepidariorum]|uniref:protein GVQW3-like n=1 Tax=Parasteatoda tepidariorum TaxID=114398 RepID=UPI001C722AD0|nr:protein GVQW3-like [Parasteatoda tepidariorum]
MELPFVSHARCELRSVIRFLCTKNVPPMVIHSQLCEVYGEKCMSVQHVRKWCREFKDGCTDINEEQRSGRPSFSDEAITKVEVSEMIPDVIKSCIQNILRDRLRYAKVCARWVPKMLTDDNKRQRVKAAREFLRAYETDGEKSLDLVVTGDETWGPLHDTGNKRTIPSVETSRLAEAEEVKANSVCDDKCLLGQERVVRIPAYRHNN